MGSHILVRVIHYKSKLKSNRNFSFLLTEPLLVVCSVDTLGVEIDVIPSGGGDYLDLSSDWDVQFCPKDWHK